MIRPLRQQRAFSLIELLVVISIVALLVALLLPALALARTSARGAVCLANQRQLVAAWLMYSDDYRVFPFGDTSMYWARVRGGWGGVHWYDADTLVPGNLLAAERPLNLYITGEKFIHSRQEIFRCPLDVGARNTRTGKNSWAIVGAGNASGEGDRTCFGLSGASYEANDWMYCVPGSTSGWGFAPAPQTPPNFRSNQGPHAVRVSPSRFIVLGDMGRVLAGRYTPDERIADDIFTSSWHCRKGEDAGQFGFLDGSARRERVGALFRQTYTYLMAEPDRLPYAGWRNPALP